MKHRILLIGNGAREHVIAETLKRSGNKPFVFTYGSALNPGLRELSEEYEVGQLNDFARLEMWAKKTEPTFALVGPDNPIADGAADLLESLGIPTVAPKKDLAKIEWSKSFTRDLLKKYHIHASPKFQVFYTATGIEPFIKELDGQCVVKADGLKGGKGVKVMGDHFQNQTEAVAYAKECVDADGKVVIEEKLIGQEFSLMCFTDGITVIDMPAVQDHKRAFAGDKGPNTGGMGSYSDHNHLLPFLTKQDIREGYEITHKTLHALYAETGSYYKGIIYGGFIATKDGVRLIEFNARFGDPEAMNVLPILKTDFVDVCQAILHQDLEFLPVLFEPRATVCKYVVPKGYPEHPASEEKIRVTPPSHKSKNLKMYYASVDQKEDGLYLSSSRALAFVGIAGTIAEAEKIAQDGLKNVEGPIAYRSDIGTAGLIRSRVEMLEKLRNTSH